MKLRFALVDEERVEAAPGIHGYCPLCRSAVIAKCGERRIWHWAHRSIIQCDHWWENKTQWHYDWQNKFPSEWQEVVNKAENGERHIADIKTAHGRVIEFQHSYIKPEERRAREAFYSPMYWVVNGLRRVRDRVTFEKAMTKRIVIPSKIIRLLVSVEGCSLLQEWSSRLVVVLFDFGGEVLWHLSPKRQNGHAVLTPVTVENFIRATRDGLPIQGIPQLIKIVSRPRLRSSPPHGFERYSAYSHRRRQKF